MISKCSSVLLLLSLLAAPLSAQSLGDVARKEEARRKAIAKPSKVYTNESLKPEPAPTPAPAAASTPAPEPQDGQPAASSPSGAVQGQPGQPGQPATPQPPAAAVDEKKTEAYWRQRMTDARDGLSRAETFQDALQTRINSLTTDFTNRDDPAQRARIATDRQKALAELDRVKKEIQQYQKAIADIQEEARRAGIPPGWLR